MTLSDVGCGTLAHLTFSKALSVDFAHPVHHIPPSGPSHFRMRARISKDQSVLTSHIASRLTTLKNGSSTFNTFPGTNRSPTFSQSPLPTIDQLCILYACFRSLSNLHRQSCQQCGAFPIIKLIDHPQASQSRFPPFPVPTRNLSALSVKLRTFLFNCADVSRPFPIDLSNL